MNYTSLEWSVLQPEAVNICIYYLLYLVRFRDMAALLCLETGQGLDSNNNIYGIMVTIIQLSSALTSYICTVCYPVLPLIM